MILDTSSAAAVLPEITTFAEPLALIATGLVFAVLSSAVTGRLPVPAPLVFLVVAAVISDLFPDLYGVATIVTVERVAVVALIVILLNGGMDIGANTLRRSLGDITSLGVLGTFATAGGATLVAHYVLGLEWQVAGVLGAAVAPTDPAVMFSVLGRREIGGRSGTVLEGEAGVNDPAGIALLLGMVAVATEPGASVLVVGQEFLMEMGLGAVTGLAGGFVLLRVVQRVPLDGRGQYPVLVLTSACLLYAGTALCGGSGFLAVFVAGLMLGDATMPYRGDVDRFVAGLANLAEIAVFLALGLTVEVGEIATRDWVGGVALAVILAVVIRPPVVALSLARSRLAANEKAFVAFAGVKGAVPILLGAFAVLGGVPDAQRVYDLIFVVVVVSVAVQGTLVGAVAEKLRVPISTRARLPWELSVHLAEQPSDEHELVVQRGAWAEGRLLSDLPLADNAWVAVVVRRDAAVPARGGTRLEADDLVLVLGPASEDLQDRFRAVSRR